MNRKTIAILLGSLTMMGMTSHASAANLFTIDPNFINGNGLSPFVGSNMSGPSSGLIQLDPTTLSASESGWINIGVINNGPTTVANTGLTSSYQLFIDFDLHATYSAALSIPSGTFSKNGSGYVVDMLTFTMYADPTNNTNFTTASSAGSGTEASFSPVPASDLITIATGSLVNGTANILSGAVSLSALTTFNLTPDGANYFVAPDPFYQFAFDAFTNTGGSVSPDYNTAVGCTAANALRPGGCQIAVISGTGTIDFVSVPEPTTIALLGLGLLSLGASKRRI
jgi:hypothetical protein